MKVGIVGDAKRGVAWERHLRPHQIIREVELCADLSEIGNVDACFLVDESEQNLDILLDGIRRGLHCFLIAPQPTNSTKLEKIYRATREAGVQVQFSHWPTLAPATQWMMDRMDRPSYLSIQREINYTQFLNSEDEFRHYWIDEVGLCLKWMDSGVHHTEAKQIYLEEKHPVAIHIFLRFDNGSTADVNIFTGSGETTHKRVACSRQEVLDCDVPNQFIRVGRLSSGSHLFFDKEKFDPAKSAEKAALMFLKSIQMKQETPYTSYDAYTLALQVSKIENRLSLFH